MIGIKSVSIVDYGVGNLFNIQRAILAAGGSSHLVSTPEQLRASDRIILPGVGAFAVGMENLLRSGLSDVLAEKRQQGTPVLGICLGMQLLMSESEEHGHHKGLNFIEGKVLRFRSPLPGGSKYKIPQISWNSLEVKEGEGGSWKNDVLKGLNPGTYMYFVHSYCVFPARDADVVATTSYGQDVFCSVVARDNVIGCQFHPERSGRDGLKLIENFLML